MAVDAIPALLVVLKKDAVADVRFEAARALGRIGTSTEAVLLLMREALKDRDPIVRVRAAESLGLLSPADEALAVAFLLRCLAESRSDPFDETPVYVFQSLRQLGPRARGCGKAIVPWLSDPRFRVYLGVLDALEEIDEDPRIVVPALTAVLADEQFGARLCAFGVVGRIVFKPLLTGRALDESVLLESALYDLHEITSSVRQARSMAIGMLGRYGPKATYAVPMLTKCLEDPKLRKNATLALAKIQGKR